MQRPVSEIILVDDAGTDDLENGLNSDFDEEFGSGRLRIIRHEQRRGAAAARITGYRAAQGEYILFGEDDAWLDPDYVQILLAKLHADPSLGLVAGRIIYLLPSEAIDDARRRFGNGSKGVKYFDAGRIAYRLDAYYDSDMNVPFTHALFMTRKSLLEKIGYDPYYSGGNGFREETDFQVGALTSGHPIMITPDTRCYHMSKRDVPSGGQSTSRIRQFYWNTYYTRYFLKKYHSGLAKMGLVSSSFTMANLNFYFLEFYRLFLRPICIIASRCVSRS